MELFQKIMVCILLLASGLLMLIRPDLVWKIEHFLSVQNGEPTEWYLAIVRIIGLGFILNAIFSVFVFLIF